MSKCFFHHILFGMQLLFEANRALQYRLSTKEFGVVIYDIATNKQCCKKHHTNGIVGVAIESPNYSNTIVSVAIEGPTIATSIDRCNREATSSNQTFTVATDGCTYSNHNV